MPRFGASFMRSSLGRRERTRKPRTRLTSGLRLVTQWHRSVRHRPEAGLLVCSICGGDRFRDRAVIWDGLVAEWEISPEERAYIDRQQGTACRTCGGTL